MNVRTLSVLTLVAPFAGCKSNQAEPAAEPEAQVTLPPPPPGVAGRFITSKKSVARLPMALRTAALPLRGIPGRGAELESPLPDLESEIRASRACRHDPPGARILPVGADEPGEATPGVPPLG